MQIKCCAACGKSFPIRTQKTGQSYCSQPDCQKVRRRRWQQEKRKSDPDYAENQARAQQAWSKRNSDYWKNYRTAHPDYVEQNRKMQHARNARSSVDKRGVIAKMDVSNEPFRLVTGLYELTPIAAVGIAKMDVWTVELRVVARAQSVKSAIAKR
ncbi:hypothetical protein GTP46_22875 [Duganella sp. FT135W]|uniref:Uncharacterized protein n=1 Tax=Duganella flavida TaxID=2692175 RepID=A0A6L8KGZ7_9BURK|nr:hypothetical protein [Duganella flavida]MYM25478.1 hypothetical protein [Duganella flavida]